MPGSTRSWVRLAVSALVTGSLLWSSLPGTVGAASPDVTGLFVDWTRSDSPPDAPVNLDSGTMTAQTGARGTVVSGIRAGAPSEHWSVMLSGDEAGRLTVGPTHGAWLFGPFSQCPMPPQSVGEVLEAEYNAGGTPARFAANFEVWCAEEPAVHAWVEVRYQSSVGFHAFSVTPLAREPYVPPDLALGDALVGGSPATGAFTVTNTGSLPLVVGAGSFSDAAFTVLPGGCNGDPVAPAASCAIAVAFSPGAPGRTAASFELLKPDLPFGTREMRVSARGTAPTSVAFRMIDEPPDSDAPWWTTMEFTWAPSDRQLFADVDFSCGTGMAGYVLPPSPYVVTIGTVLSAGPCDGTVTAYGSPESGYLASTSSIPFEVPAYADFQVGYPMYPYVKGGGTAPLAGHLIAANGVEPDGGTLTIDDETEPARLYAKAITAADNEVQVAVGPFTAGWHHLRLSYSGDARVEPRTEWLDLFVDAISPTGSAVLEDGAAYTPTERVRVALTAADAGSGVDVSRLSPTSDAHNGRLVAGENRPAIGTVDWTLASGNGTRSVWVQWRDRVGNWSKPLRRSIVVDTVRPSVGTPVVSLAAGARVGASTVPVRIQVSASDAGSGLESIGLEMSRDGGAWTRIKGSGTTIRARVQPGHAYRFRGVARDRARNVRRGSPSASVRVRVAQESSPAIKTDGTWTRSTVDGALGGSVIWSRSPASSASYRFYGRSVAWLSPVGPTRGRATVRIDGRTVGTFSLWHASGTPSRLVLAHRWAATGWHRIEVIVAGGSGSSRVDIDGFLVLR